MAHRVAYVCPCLLNCSVVIKAKDFLDEKYYPGNVVESCQDIILHTLKSLIIDQTIDLYNNVCTAFDGNDYFFLYKVYLCDQDASFLSQCP